MIIKSIFDRLLTHLDQNAEIQGYKVELIHQEVDFIKVTVNHQDDIPVYISASEKDLLCTTYLFKTSEIKPEFTACVHKEMLEANISLPLSSFAIIDDMYVVYGALSLETSIEHLIEEIQALYINTVASIEAMSSYLID